MTVIEVTIPLIITIRLGTPEQPRPRFDGEGKIMPEPIRRCVHGRPVNEPCRYCSS
jgi:hypothetical protein